MPTDTTNNNTDSNNQSSDANKNINKEAVAKYGITINEIPTEPVEPHSRYALDDTVYGFITEVTHDQKGTEVEIKDWGYCLEDNTIELGFDNMPRSQVMEEVIKSYGLVPIVDFTGLRDDTISWNNSTSNSSSSNTGGGGNITGSSGSEKIDALAKEIIGSETDPHKRMELIHNYVSKETTYEGYECTRYDTPEKCLENKNHLNCADTSRLERALMTGGGLNAQVVHGDYHFWVVVTIDGKEYACDGTNTKGIGYVWIRSAGTSQKVEGGGPYYKKNGENPDC